MIKINYSRVISNILFYILYVLLTSIVISFIIPIVFIIIWKSILAPNNPVFDLIQILIIIFVLVFSLVYRKYFYFPVAEIMEEDKVETEVRELEKVHNVEKQFILENNNNVGADLVSAKAEVTAIEQEKKEEEKQQMTKLDIKIGKEII